MKDSEDDYDFFDDESEDIEKDIEHIFEHFSFPDEIEITNLGVVKSELKLKLLKSTIKMLEKTFFWKFKSPESKKNTIKRVFISFNNLLDIDGE
jgi:hypothetical protein